MSTPGERAARAYGEAIAIKMLHQTCIGQTGYTMLPLRVELPGFEEVYEHGLRVEPQFVSLHWFDGNRAGQKFQTVMFNRPHHASKDPTKSEAAYARHVALSAEIGRATLTDVNASQRRNWLVLGQCARESIYAIRQTGVPLSALQVSLVPKGTGFPPNTVAAHLWHPTTIAPQTALDRLHRTVRKAS